MSTLIYRANSNLLELVGLKNAATGAYLNAATVTVTLQTEAGTEISGETWPLTMSYVSGSNGDYRALLSHTLGLVSGPVDAVVDADAGAGLVYHSKTTLQVQERD